MSAWVFDEYEKRYCLFAEDPRARYHDKENGQYKVCILTCPASFYLRRQKFFDTLGPIAVAVFQLVYPPASE